MKILPSTWRILFEKLLNLLLTEMQRFFSRCLTVTNKKTRMLRQTRLYICTLLKQYVDLDFPYPDLFFPRRCQARLSNTKMYLLI